MRGRPVGEMEPVVAGGGKGWQGHGGERAAAEWPCRWCGRTVRTRDLGADGRRACAQRRPVRLCCDCRLGAPMPGPRGGAKWPR